MKYIRCPQCGLKVKLENIRCIRCNHLLFLDCTRCKSNCCITKTRECRQKKQ